MTHTISTPLRAALLGLALNLAPALTHAAAVGPMMFTPVSEATVPVVVAQVEAADKPAKAKQAEAQKTKAAAPQQNAKETKSSDQKTAEKKVAPQPAVNKMHSNLWMQTSAEYEALCYQVYNGALATLSAHTTQDHPRPLAIVMDLDETVLDNGPYQTSRLKQDSDYTPESWDQWEREGWDRVGMIPGAYDFIKAMEAQGVTVVYLSNRQDANREFTAKALESLGLVDNAKTLLETHPERLLLKKETSDKQVRRDIVTDQYSVLAYFGDNLADFDSRFRPQPQRYNTVTERRLLVAENRDKFGVEWFVLPNPAYGYWERVIDMDNPKSALQD